MKVNRSFFGGYKRTEVDQLVNHLEKSVHDAEARVKLLEKEIEEIKQSAKSEKDIVSQEAEACRKHISELKSQYDTLNQQAEDYKGELDKKNIQISQLEQDYQNTFRAGEDYEEKLNQIGSVYIEALAYAQKIKDDARKESSEMVQSAINDTTAITHRKNKENYQNIETYCVTLSDAAAGLAETSAILRIRLDNLRSEMSSYGHGETTSHKDEGRKVYKETVENVCKEGTSDTDRAYAKTVITSQDQEESPTSLESTMYENELVIPSKKPSIREILERYSTK